jgi:hypothetical protein
MFVKRMVATTGAVVALSAALQMVGIQVASADAHGNASCLGLESSSIVPAGTSDEFPGGRAELQRLVKQLSGEFGVPPGAIISPVAHLHEGSHAGCDEATE